MPYKIGDTVVHAVYGLGKVVAIEEIDNAELNQECYVVEIGPIKIWVPFEKAEEGSLRPPVKSNHLKTLFDILKQPAEALPDQPYQRQIELRQRAQLKTLDSLCCIIRDLTKRSRSHNLNINDAQVLSRARENLLNEWVFSMGIQRENAMTKLDELLQEN